MSPSTKQPRPVLAAHLHGIARGKNARSAGGWRVGHQELDGLVRLPVTARLSLEVVEEAARDGRASRPHAGADVVVFPGDDEEKPGERQVHRAGVIHRHR